MLKKNEKEIISVLQNHSNLSSKEIYDELKLSIGYTSVKRILTTLKKNGLIQTTGKGKSTKYNISLSYQLFVPIDIEQYFEKEIDEREIIESFNLILIEQVLSKIELFTNDELIKLNQLQNNFVTNVSKLSGTQYKKEFEKLAIDLSWKSSQIEGNTYSLLETERLLKEKETASGKTKDEAVMLLNHKDAIDFILENPSYVNPLSVARIEDIHSLLIKELGGDRNIRSRRVGITGTNYRPLDNEFQIKEALTSMCLVINKRENIFEKALLALVLISYIQAFNDGNKRTARIISNAILISNKYCPISFRTIDSIEYKKAMLIFYEQNNITVFKGIFMEQFEFATRTYF